MQSQLKTRIYLDICKKKCLDCGAVPQTNERNDSGGAIKTEMHLTGTEGKGLIEYGNERGPPPS